MNQSTDRARALSPYRTAKATLFPLGATLAAIVALTMVPSSAAIGATQTPLTSSAPCNINISSGSGVVVGSMIVGVTAGTTKVALDCNASSSATYGVEASLLAAIGTAAVNLSSEADINALGLFAPSSTDTGCPAATAGSCTVASFTVPATFAAADAKATCPPTQAQINAGVFGCALAVANAAAKPLAGAEYLMTYANQPLPNAATISATPTQGPAGSNVNVSDATGNTGFWWANALQLSQAVALGTTPMSAPANCASGGGFGNVPAPFLVANWFASGSSTAIPSSAAGVLISNTCFDNTVLHAPALSGSIPVPATLILSTTYTVYLCELNTTPYPSNDPSATTNCGAAPGGASWIDASFTFTVATSIAQSALTLTSVAGSVGTPLSLTTGGGSGTGAVTYSVTNGTASGCALTAGSLRATSGGTCVVTATKAADNTYLVATSQPTSVAMAGNAVIKMVSTRIALASAAKVLPVRISCAGKRAHGVLTFTARVSVKVKIGTKTTTKVENLTFGSASYSIGSGTAQTVTIHLSAASRNFLEGNPDRPIIIGSVYNSISGGRQHNYIGKVTLIK